ncbi:MAG TPA: RNA-binding cell elongation regulator Jag/EloR [Acidimicrobiales bacterium]|nr:RNA-binding cell elongation regulator Jag/EloR [Acidimicrobiales bacterium]
MDWVETTGRNVEEAKKSALEQLGVEESDAEFEVVAEAKIGLFGRLKEEARVRARVQPRYPRSKGERRDRRRSRASRPDQAAAGNSRPAPAAEEEAVSSSGSRRRPRSDENVNRPQTPSGARRRRRTGGVGSIMSATEDRDNGPANAVSNEELAKAAEDFLRGLLREMGARAEVSSSQQGEELIEVLVSGEELGTLIGPRGSTLLALQELTRIVLQRHLPHPGSRVVVDVNGYRKRRQEALARFAQQVAAEVLASNKKRALEPMPPADRKVVHDAVNEIAGVSTISEGEEPNRRVVLIPADSASGPAAQGDGDATSKLESTRP